MNNVTVGDLNGEWVAVKVAKREHAGEALKEVETMASFNHANILRLVGVATNQGTLKLTFNNFSPL